MLVKELGITFQVQLVRKVGNSIVRSEESEMVGNRLSRSEKRRKNNKYQSDLPIKRFRCNLLCQQEIPSKLRQVGFTIRASASQSRFTPRSSDRFALWVNTVLLNTYFFAVFKFKLVINIKLNAIVRRLVE